jgi:hypothetical protein
MTCSTFEVAVCCSNTRFAGEPNSLRLFAPCDASLSRMSAAIAEALTPLACVSPATYFKGITKGTFNEVVIRRLWLTTCACPSQECR